MKVLRNDQVSIDRGKCTSEYLYRLTENTYTIEDKKNVKVYGIEIERLDYSNDQLVNIERDGESKISTIQEKVEELYNKAHKYTVSPLHFIDIFGEYIDECVNDFA